MNLPHASSYSEAFAGWNVSLTELWWIFPLTGTRTSTSVNHKQWVFLPQLASALILFNHCTHWNCDFFTVGYMTVFFSSVFEGWNILFIINASKHKFFWIGSQQVDVFNFLISTLRAFYCGHTISSSIIGLFLPFRCRSTTGNSRLCQSLLSVSERTSRPLSLTPFSLTVTSFFSLFVFKSSFLSEQSSVRLSAHSSSAQLW